MERQEKKVPEVERELVFVPALRFSSKEKVNQGQAQGAKKGRQTNPSLWTGQKEKVNIRPSPSPTKEQKGKAVTAEEASLPETETQDSQWQETFATSQYETWQADGSTCDWSIEVGWDDSEAHYQDWGSYQVWQSKTSWFAISLSETRLRSWRVEPYKRVVVPREWPGSWSHPALC